MATSFGQSRIDQGSRPYKLRRIQSDSLSPGMVAPEVNKTFRPDCRVSRRQKRRQKRKRFLISIIRNRVKKRNSQGHSELSEKIIPPLQEETPVIPVSTRTNFVLRLAKYEKLDTEYVSNLQKQIEEASDFHEYQKRIIELLMYSSTTIPPGKPKIPDNRNYPVKDKWIAAYAVTMYETSCKLLWWSFFRGMTRGGFPIFFDLAATTIAVQRQGNLCFEWSTGIMPGICRQQVLEHYPVLCKATDGILKAIEDVYAANFGAIDNEVNTVEYRPRRLVPIYDVDNSTLDLMIDYPSFRGMAPSVPGSNFPDPVRTLKEISSRRSQRR